MISGNSAGLLDGWVPVLRTHGVLLLLRRDLVAMPVPALTEPPVTTDLYFSNPSGDWGTARTISSLSPVDRR